MLSHVDMLSFEISTQANSSVNDGHCFLMFDIQLLPAIRSNDQTLRRLQHNLGSDCNWIISIREEYSQDKHRIIELSRQFLKISHEKFANWIWSFNIGQAVTGQMFSDLLLFISARGLEKSGWDFFNN